MDMKARKGPPVAAQEEVRRGYSEVGQDSRLNVLCLKDILRVKRRTLLYTTRAQDPRRRISVEEDAILVEVFWSWSDSLSPVDAVLRSASNIFRTYGHGSQFSGARTAFCLL